MPIVFKNCASIAVSKYSCEACSTPEKGRVRGGAFIRKGYMKLDDTTKRPHADFTTAQYWETGIEAGDIIVIPKTAGTFDGGTPIEASRSYGDDSKTITGKTFVASLADLNHKGNDQFWDTIERAPGEYYFAFITGTELRVSMSTVTVSVSDPVEDDDKSDVNWTPEITWDQSTPRTVPILDATNVRKYFSCFEVTP